jgi:hypothetical protein
LSLLASTYGSFFSSAKFRWCTLVWPGVWPFSMFWASC